MKPTPEITADAGWPARDGTATRTRFRGSAPQVWAAIGTLIALLAVAVTIAVLLIQNLPTDTGGTAEQHIRYSTAIDAAALHAKGIANDERGFLMSGDPEFTAEIEVRTDLARAAFGEALDAASGPQVPAVQEAWDGFERWLVALDDEITTYEAGDRDAAVEASLGPTRELRKDYEGALARAQLLIQTGDDVDTGSSGLAYSLFVAILLGVLIVAIGIGAAVSIWVVRTTLTPEPR
jgi:methyl-accepting chemotaxis protein